MSFEIPYLMLPVLTADAPKHCELFLLNQSRLRNCRKPKLHMAIVKNRKYYEPSQRDISKKPTGILRNKGTGNPSLSYQISCSEYGCEYISQHKPFTKTLQV